VEWSSLACPGAGRPGRRPVEKTPRAATSARQWPRALNATYHGRWLRPAGALRHPSGAVAAGAVKGGLGGAASVGRSWRLLTTAAARSRRLWRSGRRRSWTARRRRCSGGLRARTSARAPRGEFELAELREVNRATLQELRALLTVGHEGIAEAMTQAGLSLAPTQQRRTRAWWAWRRRRLAGRRR
jgi:hypothetical protein